MKWLSAICIIACLGCGPNPYFSESVEINPLGWTGDKAIKFSPEIIDTSSIYELQLIIDHQSDYRYENIYFLIRTYFPDGTSNEEKLSVNLATHKGEWVGKCSGENCKLKVYLLENFKFPEPGTYGFELSQYTRDERLEGIKKIKIQLFRKKTG